MRVCWYSGYDEAKGVCTISKLKRRCVWPCPELLVLNDEGLKRWYYYVMPSGMADGGAGSGEGEA